MKKLFYLRSRLLLLFMLVSTVSLFGQGREEETIVFNFQCKAVLESVSFKGTAGTDYITIHHDYQPHAAFTAPHWTKGNAELKPVGYVAGSSAQVEATFTFPCESGPQGQVFAKGAASNGITFSEQVLTINGARGTYNVQKASKNFTANMIDYFDKFTIKWQVSFDNKKTWEDAGTSENPLYVPLSQLNGCNLDDDRVFYSVIHYACKPAKGLSDEKDIFAKIWEVFKTLKIPRIDKPKFDKMTYWGANNPLGVGCRGMAGLLNYEDANCGEWSLFLRNCLGMHGTLPNIKGCSGTYLLPQSVNPEIGNNFISKYQNTFDNNPINPRIVFLVKKWEQLDFDKFYFIGKKYTNFLQIPMQQNTANYAIGNPFTAPNGTLITRGDKTDDSAQGMIDPETVFQDHAVVCMPDGKIYDPSYGTGPFSSNLDWEAQSVDGYAIETEFLDDMKVLHYLVMKYENETPLYQIPYTCN